MFYFLADEQKPISWEDPLQIPRSNSVSSVASKNNFNPQSVTRKSSTSIITLPNRNNHNSYTLNSLNNNHQETNFYSNPQHFLKQDEEDHFDNTQLLSLFDHNPNSSPFFTNANIKKHKKLEHTPSARTVSSEDSWCSSIGSGRSNSEHNDCFDDGSSINDDEDSVSERSSSLSSTPRNSRLRSTFNKATQHLSLDKWRNHINNINNNHSNSSHSSNSSANHSFGNATMPSTTTTTTSSANNQEPSNESLSRLTRWFSMRRGSNQYDLNSNSGRSGSVEKSFDNDDKCASGRKMPQLQEVKNPPTNYNFNVLTPDKFSSKLRRFN